MTLPGSNRWQAVTVRDKKLVRRAFPWNCSNRLSLFSSARKAFPDFRVIFAAPPGILSRAAVAPRFFSYSRRLREKKDVHES